MTRTADELALYVACREHPDEDTPRLVLADALEESDPARAELIRVQCEWERLKFVSHPNTDQGRAETRRVMLLDARATELRNLHGDRWRRGPACERCHGSNQVPVYTGHGDHRIEDCWACGGTGDMGGLMRLMPLDDPESGLSPIDLRQPPRVEYVRGLKRVHARLADLWERERLICPECEGRKILARNLFNPGTSGPSHVRCGTCDGSGGVESEGTWRPTPWLLAVCRRHPDVSEVWVENINPYKWTGDDVQWRDGFFWHNSAHKTTGVMTIPPSLWEMVKDEYPTDAAARVALARAVARWAHGFLSPNGT